ncbi:MAG TPA: hypothetical protein VJV39_19245 [Dongiaceae bacterium]|nr:hypothetical protein [Dongiaceae bacterium]
MRLRTLMMGMFAAGLVAAAGTTQAAERIEIAVGSMAEIKVDGPSSKSPYETVETEKLEYVVSARSNRWRTMGIYIYPGKYDSDYFRRYTVHTTVEEKWSKYRITASYLDPDPTKIRNERTSPVDLCNERLTATSGAAREKFLKTGVSFIHHQAYRIIAYDDSISNSDSGSVMAPVKITCMALERPRPRSKSETKGPPPREGREMAPTIKKAALRIEPAKVVQDGEFLCPSELKLHGYMETIREFYGKALFVGPHYLSAITTLNLQGKGSRNVTATYEMNWHKMGGFTTQPNAEPAKQKLTFHFNVADKDGKLRKTVEETVEVSCKKIKVAVPTVGDEMTVKPAN